MLLTVFRQIDTLGIAATFHVEYTVIAPAMFIVADKAAVRVGGQRGLARTGQAEEQGHVPFRTFVAGAVHAQQALLGQQIVHHREDGFLQFTGIQTAADEHGLGIEVQDDEGLRICMVRCRISLHAGQGDDCKIFLNGAGFITLDEQLVHKYTLPGLFVNEFHPDLILGISTSLHIVYVDLMGLDKSFTFCQQAVIGLLGAGLVRRPADHIMGQRRIYDELVLGRTACMGSRGHPQGTFIRKAPFPVTDSFLYQFPYIQVTYYFFCFC